VTPPWTALDRVTSKVNAVVPELPSRLVAETLDRVRVALSSLVMVPLCGLPAVVMVPAPPGTPGARPEIAPSATEKASSASTLVSPLTSTVMVLTSPAVPLKRSEPSLFT